MIAIDGSFGEGGGAILRQAIGLAAYARRPIRITNTRARRPKPGLQPQHLEAVRAATAVVGARVTGATLGSTQLVFRPGDLRPGTYALDVGTAGVCSRGEFTLDVRGGTDVPWSPPVDYLRVVMLPALRDIGLPRSPCCGEAIIRRAVAAFGSILLDANLQPPLEP